MAEFQQIRDELLGSRDAHVSAQSELSVLNYRLRVLERQLAALERREGRDNQDTQQRLLELKEQIATQQQAIAGKKRQLAAAQVQLDEREKVFGQFEDPRHILESAFPANNPFLLFPLRMETRFKTVNNQPQLWIRVYPDDCMVDSFEPLLSQKEVNNAARFWAEYYSAGKPADPMNPEPAVLELQQSAWRLIVSAQGDGRAAWITRQLIPDEATSIFPVRMMNTVILSIVAANWNAADQPAIFGLFRQLWLASGADKATTNIKAAFNLANPTLNADDLIARFQPVNFTDSLPPGLKREDADLQFAVVVFTDLDKKAGKDSSWSQHSRVNILPERLALIRFKNNQAMEPVFGNTIPYPLATSPDPSPDADPQLKQTPGGDLEFAPSIQWLADFETAVASGMGFRINLGPDELDGFSRLMVLGIKLGADAAGGTKQLAALFEHHFFSKKGFRIIPQGTPTNNTGVADAGFTSGDNPDESFEQYFNNKKGFVHSDDPHSKADGQWLAEWLGLDEHSFQKVLHSGSMDQADARNMNTALYPGTLGYALESMMQFVFEPTTLKEVRSFFNTYVSGRGPVPAIRIGNQPYGILPTTAFSRLSWIGDPALTGFELAVNNNEINFLKQLYALLLRIENYWNNNFKTQVAQINQKSTEVYKTLLDVLGLHPDSAEFHRRYLESLIEMSNSMSVVKPGFQLHKDVVMSAMNLLKTTGAYASDAIPQIAALLALPREYAVTQLVDDVPLSETAPIGVYTTDKKNYLGGLAAQARKSSDAVRTGEGFSKRPSAELYRLLKYAIEQSYHTSSIDAVADKNVFNSAVITTMRAEQPFIQQDFKGAVTDSRYALMMQTIPAVSPTKTVSEFIHDSLLEPVVPAFSKYLAEQLSAMDKLEAVATAKLERALVEHLDCCSYRLDAWKTAVVTRGLTAMRENFPGADGRQLQGKGLYLGAFGWLENVRPNRNAKITNKEIPQDLVKDFNPDNKKTFLSDSTNEGYIHAPSLNQAVTAAVLRNGYISHGRPDGNSVLSVNLSSERIRLALSVIEGIQGGQSLAALLGYHFERNLHDRSDLTAKGIDGYIYPLRKLFPLVADKLKETKLANSDDPSVDPDTVPITAIEARNVIDGVKLINHVKTLPDTSRLYPYGLALAHPDPVVNNAITEAVNEILDIADAVADLGIAESVHHVVMGNQDRAAGVLESFSKGNYPQEPDVIRTPRNGATLTHRVGVPLNFSVSIAGSGPRAMAEPSVNEWLKTMLPPMEKIVCNGSYISRTDGLQKSTDISLKDIGLSPIDLIYTLHALDTQSMNDSDDRFLFRLLNIADPRIDGNIHFNYTDAPLNDANFSLFQVMPLVKSLRALLVESIPLQPNDVALPNEASKKNAPAPELPLTRITDLKAALQNALKAAKDPGGIIHDFNALPDQTTATPADLNNILSQSDVTLTKLAAFLLDLGTYGIPQTGSGNLYTQLQQWFTSLKNRLQELVTRWQKKWDDLPVLEAKPLPTTEDFQAMERLLSSTVNEVATALTVAGKKAAFKTALDAIKLIGTKNQPTLSTLLAELQTINTAPFDVIVFDTSDILSQVPVFIYDQQKRLQSIVDDIEKKRLPSVEALLTAMPALTPADQAKQTEAAVRLILGDDFRLVPKYVLPTAQAAEISNSWSAKNQLLDYLSTVQQRTNPTEDWLHGIARVHEKMKHLENILLLRQAFEMKESDFGIHPVQLPFQTNKYHWLAMPFKQGDVDLEKTNTLLYTAFVAEAVPAPAEICGMLVDEWTELIPASKETTGISFQYNRPNSEAPQTMLLVTPANFSGNWQWNDLVDALVYTLEAARSRGIEPGQIDKTAFASFLPMVLGAESLFPYSIVLDNAIHYMDEKAVINYTK